MIQKSQIPFEALRLRAKSKVHTLFSGESLSKYYGEGSEFAELRDYHQGDDVRRINWLATARAQRPKLNLHYADKEISVAIAAYADATMHFGTSGFQALSAYTMLLIGYAALHRNHSLSITLRTSDRTRHFAFSKEESPLVEAAQSLYAYDDLGKAVEMQHFFDDTLARLQRRSLLFLVGTFFDPAPFARLASAHETSVLLLRPAPEALDAIRDNMLLVDPLSNKRKEAYRVNLRSWKEALERHDEVLVDTMRQAGIRYGIVRNEAEALHSLHTLFSTAR